MAVFSCEMTVLFRHCDTAGIVFYPRYVEMISDVIETWFAEGLGLPFDALHLERGLGVPTVRLEIDFRAASRLGERLTWTLSLGELRSRAFVTRIEARCDGELRLAARSVLVFAELEGLRPTAVPEDLRPTMAGYLQAESEEAREGAKA